jgi:aspartyl/asparaginyl-tRNA synthetase
MKKHSLHSSFYPHIDAKKFTKVTRLLREFFLTKGFLEVHTQNRLSILAACEDPFNISTFYYNKKRYPLPQTGQMWLEHEILTQPDEVGFFCLSTSYRNEPNPIEGRHCLIFPMFEFELHGDMDTLADLEVELLNFLGFKDVVFSSYEDAADRYGVSIIDSNVEDKMYGDLGEAILLYDFPERTSPFWNMKRNDNFELAKKIDVILFGQETIGSAERSCNKSEMRNLFFSIENGKYANKLFELFGYDNVIKELNEFLELPFIPRVGAGIGITRLIRAMELKGLL